MSRTVDQVVEVLHFMGGEDSPRRVLCPWRAHPLASALPAVARATAACSVRCEWMIGRGVGLVRGSSSGWCVRCSSGCDNLENGGQADSRRQWLGPLTTDGQPCGEHLTHQLLSRTQQKHAQSEQLQYPHSLNRIPLSRRNKQNDSFATLIRKAAAGLPGTLGPKPEPRSFPDPAVSIPFARCRGRPLFLSKLPFAQKRGRHI